VRHPAWAAVSWLGLIITSKRGSEDNPEHSSYQ
jgi:hypothetical protein